MDIENNKAQQAASSAPPAYSPPYPGGATGYSNHVFPSSYAGGNDVDDLNSSSKVPHDHTGANYPVQTGFQYPPGGMNPPPAAVFVQIPQGPLENPPPHYLIQSILNMVFCCFAFGIVAIMRSMATKQASELGQSELALSNSREAKKWNIYALVGGISFWVAFIVTFCVLVFVDW